MQNINSSHAGIQSCIRRAREIVYWPRMSSELESFIKECQTCQESSQSQQNEPLISSEIPELPSMWQYVADDLFELKGKSYLVTVDHYSDFFEVDALSTKNKTEVIKKQKQKQKNKCKPTLQDIEYQRSYQPTIVLRSMHMSLRNLHKLMDLNISPVLLVIHSPSGKPKMQ